MIRTGSYDDTKDPYIEIDLRKPRYKNRRLTISKNGKHPLSTDAEPIAPTYDITVDWTAATYHPSMQMSEDDLLDLSDALSVWAQEIRTKTSAAPKKRGVKK